MNVLLAVFAILGAIVVGVKCTEPGTEPGSEPALNLFPEFLAVETKQADLTKKTENMDASLNTVIGRMDQVTTSSEFKGMETKQIQLTKKVEDLDVSLKKQIGDLGVSLTNAIGELNKLTQRFENSRKAAVFLATGTIGGNTLTFGEAEQECKKLGTTMVSVQNLVFAFAEGSQLCYCGWVTAEKAYYVSQGVGKCAGEKVGVLLCDWQDTWDVWCKTKTF